MTEAHMTESMIEKCARAASIGVFENIEAPWEMLGPAEQARARKIACAVLHALREPDEGMKVTGGLALEKAMFEDQKELIFDVAGDGFTAMIDHILNESKSDAEP